MIFYACAALLIPLSCFALLALVWPLRHAGRFAGFLSSLSAIASFGCAVGAWATSDPARPAESTLPWLVRGGQTIAEVGVRVDATSATMLVVVTLVAACVQVYSMAYMADEPRPDIGRYYTWHSLFIVAMGGLVLAPNLLQLLVSWELVGLCSYLLIGHYWRKPSAGRAAVKAVWITRLADIGLMSGIVLHYAQTGGFLWQAGAGSALVAGLLFLGVMGKSAQFPLHIWLPDAMEGPTPVSALLHAATMVAAGVYLIVRAWPIFEAAPDVLTIMAWVGAVTALLAACVAVVQTDIKKVLAYSTCSQLGYMVSGLGSGEMMGGYFHLTTHAFFKALLFLGAGSVIHAVHSNELTDMGGLRRRMGPTFALFLVGALALAGFPGLAGFFSKDLILEELYEAHLWGPLVMLLAAAALTAFYMTRVVCMAFLGEVSKKAEHAHESPIAMVGPMAMLGLLAVVAGYGAGDFAEDLGLEYSFHLAPVGIAATVLGLGGIGVGYAKYGQGGLAGLSLPGLASFIRGGPVDSLFVGGFRRVLLPFAGAMGWLDRYVVDGVMNLVGVGALDAGARLRRVQSGQIQHLLVGVALGLVVFALWGVVGA